MREYLFYLLLLVGFDTLTYRKDYDRSPILVGHHLAWKILITDGREVNKKGACLKISFTSVLKIELWHLYKSLLPSAKGLSIYFYVASPPSKNKRQKLSRAQLS